MRSLKILHLSGHVHKAHETLDDGTTTFSNAAMMDERYESMNAAVVLLV